MDLDVSNFEYLLLFSSARHTWKKQIFDILTSKFDASKWMSYQGHFFTLNLLIQKWVSSTGKYLNKCSSKIIGEFIQRQTLWSVYNYLTWALTYLNVLLTHFWIGKLSGMKSFFVRKRSKLNYSISNPRSLKWLGRYYTVVIK